MELDISPRDQKTQYLVVWQGGGMAPIDFSLCMEGRKKEIRKAACPSKNQNTHFIYDKSFQ